MIRAVPIPGKKKSEDICRAFIEGAPRSATGVVVYGVNESNLHEFSKAAVSGQPWYYVDNAFFDTARGKYFRVARNRVQHNGVGVSDGKRFAALGLEVQPWQHRPQGTTLLVEQSDSFMTCVAKEPRWLNDTLRGLAPPLPVAMRRWTRNKLEAGTTLQMDLEKARLVITHSSAAAIEALLAGVRVHVSPMSAAFGIVGRQQELRHGLFNVLADQQFTLDELRSGVAWAELREEHD